MGLAELLTATGHEHGEQLGRGRCDEIRMEIMGNCITWIDSKRCEVHTRYVAAQRSSQCGNVHPQNRQTEVQMFGIHILWD